MVVKGHKRCPKCGVTRPVTEFQRNRSRGDGYQVWCKVCFAERYQRDKAKVKARVRRYKAARREEMAAKQRAYYRANRAERRSYARAWAKKNLERTREYARADANRRRTGRKADSDGRFYADLLRFDPCSYCGGLAGEADHIDAVTKSGDNDWMNLTAACRSCNAQKSDKKLLAYLAMPLTQQ